MNKLGFLSLGAAAVALCAAGCASSSAAAVPRIQNPAPQGATELLDGFEDGISYWAILGRNDDAALYTDVSTAWASEGTYSGTFEFSAPDDSHAGSGGAHAVFWCKSLLTSKFSGYTRIYLDVNNTSPAPVGVAFGVQDTNWAYRQSDVQVLGTGVNRNVWFDLAAMQIPDASSVRQITLSLTPKSAGKILVDNVRLVK